MIHFAEVPLWANLALLAAGSVAVWMAGTRLAVDAEALTRKTQITEAYAGLLLLAFATSLPEVVTSFTASLSGNADLATSNLIGGVSMQTAVLAVADAVGLKQPLTWVSPGPVLLMQAVLLILLLAIVIAGVSTGGAASVFGVGLATVGLAVAYVAGLFILRAYESHPGWRAVDAPERPRDVEAADAAESGRPARTVKSILRSFTVAALVVLAAGWLVTMTADAVAVQTGIGATFIGATLLATASSLPELSTTIQATRQGAYKMAISNIFGSNAMDVTLLFAADVVYRQGPILAEASGALVFAAALSILLTCVYLIGLLDRGDRRVLRLGWDSVAVTVLYGGGLWILYTLS